MHFILHIISITLVLFCYSYQTDFISSRGVSILSISAPHPAEGDREGQMRSCLVLSLWLGLNQDSVCRNKSNTRNNLSALIGSYVFAINVTNF